MKTEMLKLTLVDIDFWDRPVYKDQNGKLWKDIELGDHSIPSLYSSTNNDFDGEPNNPINQEYTIEKQYMRNPKRFEYMMLSRLQSDCKTHLQDNCHPSCRIKEENKAGIIEEMKRLWNQFTEEEKPKWITWEEILNYETKIME